MHDPDCSVQWELPFTVASSYDLQEDDRVAWVRALGVDERLSVIATIPGSELSVGDKIVEIDGYHRDNTVKMAQELTDKRDAGQPFSLLMSDGRSVEVKPFDVCRGHVLLANPAHAKVQGYHWLAVAHPLEIARQSMTPDEALWMVLWTQGLSEQGGARMKAYQYGTKLLSTAFTVASIASGVGAVTKAAASATATAAATASSAVATVAAKQAAQQLADEVGRNVVQDMARTVIKEATKATALNAVQAAALNRAGLSGISWVAGTVFDLAYQWAFKRIVKLGADPLAPFTLHQKLAEVSAFHNAMVFDPDRLTAIKALAASAGMSDKVARVLDGEDIEAE